MSHTRSNLWGAAAALLVGLLALATAANADEPLRIHNLTVAGGEGTWQTVDDFRLNWDPVDPATLAAIRSVDYLVRDAGGTPTGPIRRSGEALRELRQVHIYDGPGPGRATPGRYTLEVWFEGPGGDGPHADATLRFDDVPPAAARALSPASWIRAGSEAIVRIEHPAAPLPASGIRGYAVELDDGSGISPCAGPDSCTEAETDLHAGAGGDSISLGKLSEGTNIAVVVAVAGSGLRSQVATRTALRVDGSEPRVALAGAPAGWSDRPLQITAIATDSQAGISPAGPNGPLTSIAVDNGVPAIAPGGSVTTTVRGDGAHQICYYGRDAVGNSGEAQPASATIRIDETAPSLAFAKAQDPAEPERIEATVSDALSGLGSTRGSIAVRPAGSSRQFKSLPTRVTAGRLAALWDSDAYPDGSYEFRAVGYDVAGNPAATNRRLDGTRMVLSNPVKRPTALELGFGGRRMVWHRCRQERDRVRCHREVIASFERRPTTRAVPYGRGVPVAGRLVSASGSPLVGLPVQLVESFVPGAATPRRTTTVLTNADGTFLAHLAPGPSRSVEVDFTGSRLLSAATGDQKLQLAVRTAVHLHASSASAAIGGAPVVFSGQISHEGASIPAEGSPVQLQFRVPGSDWTEFRSVQTNAQGRFRYPYSFNDDDSRGVRFQFRAYVPAQPGWPYAPATSPAVFVTGR